MTRTWRAGACLCAGVGEQKKTSCVLFYHSPPIPLKQGLSLNLVLKFSSRLEVIKPQKSSCLCSTQSWGYRHSQACPACGIGAGI